MSSIREVSRLFEFRTPVPGQFYPTVPRYLRLCLFRDVHNAHELADAVAEGQFHAALIRPELVFDSFHVRYAASKAMDLADSHLMTTWSVTSELVYLLYPHYSVDDALRTFGISGASRNILVAIVDDEGGHGMEEMGALINGRAVPLEELDQLVALDELQEVYALTDDELDLHDYFLSIVILEKLRAKFNALNF
uniref:tRNA-specific adenosine deaminase-like protein 3 n=1 Tax=Steinernema glaseri TaxID=37863 RepID=A0A1I7YVY7_9BILA